MFEFKPDIPDAIEAEIQLKLDAIEDEHDVRFLFAIESGSRAWGFPSPDSDFDVRFVYAHSQDWYLSIAPGRDVIEVPLEDDWDINGWDIKKALGLLLKPNPVLLEWLSSPIRYRWNEVDCQALNRFAAQNVKPEACLAHYFHLAKNGWSRNIDGETQVKLKKYFYVLRPILAIRWIRLNPDHLPPMNFQTLVRGTTVAEGLQAEINTLLDAKAKVSEIGVGERIDSLDALILEELKWAKQNVSKKPNPSHDIRRHADQLFRDLIGPH